MGNLSDIDPVIALLYDGVTNSGDWYDGLDAVAQAFGSVGFHYLAMDGQSGVAGRNGHLWNVARVGACL